MAEALKLPELHVVGLLWRFWSWADQHTTCNALNVTEALIDRITCNGFAYQLRSVGWLSVTENGVVLPNFDEHNGQTAKKRALTSQRVKRFRNGDSVTNALPEKRREEKRRDNTIPPISPSSETPVESLKSPAQLRAEKLHHKRANTPWDKSELAAWKVAQASVEATSAEEWDLLERFYAAPQTETFARKALATTLNNWSGEIQRARSWAEQAAKAPKSGTNPHQRPAPTKEDHLRDGWEFSKPASPEDHG